MKKNLLVLILVLSIVSCLFITGCSKDKSTTTQAPQTGNQSGSSEVAKTSDNELDNLLKAASATKDFSFEMVSTATNAGQTVSTQGKYWMSGEKMRMEMEAEGMKAVTIINDKGELWMYNPADKTAMKLPKTDTENEFPNDWTEADQNNMKIVGHEKVDGYDCTIVSLTEDADVTKMWLRKDIGMPVKMETKSPQGDLLIEYKNFNLEKQSSDLFELPADAQVLEIPDMSKVPGN